LTLLEEKILEAGLGLSALGFIVFFFGVLKLYYFFTGFILIGILFLLLWPRIKNIFPLPLRRWHWYGGLFGLRSIRLIVIAIAVSLLIILMGVFIPPLDYDTLEYHLGVPAQYIKAHGIIYLPYNVYSNFPFHMEMLYTLGLLLNGPILAKMIHFLFLILTLLIILVLGNKLYPKAGYPAALIFVNIPIVAVTGAKAYNELGLTFFGLLCIYSLWEWNKKKDKKFLILASLFCGSAISVKYTAIIFFLVPFFIFVLLNSLKKIRCAGVFIICSLLIASPWFIKNSAYTGNPVFPVAYGQLGGKNWGDFEAARFKKHHQIELTDFKRLIEVPKRIITGQEGRIGITLLLFLPFLFFIKNTPLPLKCLGMYSLFYFLIWFFSTHHMPRFLIPMLPLLSILAGFCIFYFLNLRKLLGYTMIAFLTTGLIFNGARLFYQFSLIHPLPFIIGKDSEEEYLSKIFYLYPAIDFINIYLPQDSKTLFIAEARTFYCKKDFMVNTPLDKNIIVEIAGRSKRPKDILDALKKMGITHILYNDTEVKRISRSYNSFNWPNPKAQENYMDFMQKYLKIIFSQDGVFVAEIV
jgi:hypothetical protein